MSKAREKINAAREMMRKLEVLSRLASRQLMGTRPRDDPRMEFVVGLEFFKNLANVQLEVLIRLCIEKLGITREEFMKFSTEELSKQLEEMEKDLGVRNWDAGQPIFDLVAFKERTSGWPL